MVLGKTSGAERTLLEVIDVHTDLDTPAALVHAVDGVTFSLDTGETLGVVGESGSGKTTLGRTIAGLLPKVASTTGQVRFDGSDLLSLSHNKRRSYLGKDIGYVFQDSSTALNPVVRIGRQVVESLRYNLQANRRSAEKQALDLLERVGLPNPSHLFGLYPHELSGGMRQRVCIAIALSCSPSLLIADEPTTALDVTIQRQILDLLSDLQRDTRMAMILISHDLGVVAGRTRNLMVMYSGQVVERGATQSLFEHTRHPYTAGLLASIPRLEAPRHLRLEAIPGRPAIPINPPEGCRFAPRCQRAEADCFTQPIAVRTDPNGAQFRCRLPLDGVPVHNQENG